MTTSTSRLLVRDGVAAYLGGTFNNNVKGYQNGPLDSAGVGTVRSGWPKRANMQDFVNGVGVGRGMGAAIVVEFGEDREWRRAIAGAPQVDGSNNIIAGGIRFILYPTTLHGFHIAQKRYAEDAEADVDSMIEAIKQQMRLDRTLGMPGVITDAGQTNFGVKSWVGHPGEDANGRTGTYFTVKFEVRTQIIA